jgi:hypothetical protein
MVYMVPETKRSVSFVGPEVSSVTYHRTHGRSMQLFGKQSRLLLARQYLRGWVHSISWQGISEKLYLFMLRRYIRQEPHRIDVPARRIRSSSGIVIAECAGVDIGVSLGCSSRLLMGVCVFEILAFRSYTVSRLFSPLLTTHPLSSPNSSSVAP